MITKAQIKWMDTGSKQGSPTPSTRWYNRDCLHEHGAGSETYLPPESTSTNRNRTTKKHCDCTRYQYCCLCLAREETTAERCCSVKSFCAARVAASILSKKKMSLYSAEAVSVQPLSSQKRTPSPRLRDNPSFTERRNSAHTQLSQTVATGVDAKACFLAVTHPLLRETTLTPRNQDEIRAL